MPSFSSLLRKGLLVAAGFVFASSPCLADGISATATYTSSLVSPGVYRYGLTLDNTGTTNIGTFWFAWVPGAGFLSAVPNSVTNPAGWTDSVTNAGAAIRWVGTGSPLAAGQSLSGFGFQSTETPDQLLLTYTGTGVGAGDVVTTSFVYIAAPLTDPGAVFVPTAVAATPEPGSWILMLTGAVLLFVLYRRRPQLLLEQ